MSKISKRAVFWLVPKGFKITHVMQSQKMHQEQILIFLIVFSTASSPSVLQPTINYQLRPQCESSSYEPH